MAGSIERRNGRYRARFTPPGGKEVNQTFDRKGDAQDWLDEQRGQAVRGTWIDPRGGKTLFGPFARDYLDNRPHVRESTRTREDANYRNHIEPEFAHRQLRAIPRNLVQSWVTALSNSGLAPSTVISIYDLFKKIMRSAVIDERLLPESPCRGILLPRLPDDEVTIPTVGQLAIVGARLPARYRRTIDVVEGIGVRQGEMFGLTEDRIRWLRRTVVVDRQLQRLPELQRHVDEHGRPPKGVNAVPLGRGLFLVDPKSRNGRREIPVSDLTLEVLAAQIEEFPPGDCDETGQGLVFTTGTGRPVVRNVFDDAWERATRRRLASDPALPDPAEYRGARDSALAPYFTIHDGRHFYASMLIAHGVPLPRLAKVLGDTQEEVLKTYSHLWPDDDERVRAAVDEVLSSPAPAPAVAVERAPFRRARRSG